jgi:hypothetical protein
VSPSVSYVDRYVIIRKSLDYIFEHISCTHMIKKGKAIPVTGCGGP